MACPYCRAYPGNSCGKSKNYKIIEHRLGRAKQGLKEIKDYTLMDKHEDWHDAFRTLKYLAEKALKEIEEIK